MIDHCHEWVHMEAIQSVLHLQTSPWADGALIFSHPVFLKYYVMQVHKPTQIGSNPVPKWFKKEDIGPSNVFQLGAMLWVPTELFLYY